MCLRRAGDARRASGKRRASELFGSALFLHPVPVGALASWADTRLFLLLLGSLAWVIRTEALLFTFGPVDMEEPPGHPAVPTSAAVVTPYADRRERHPTVVLFLSYLVKVTLTRYVPTK